MSLLLLNKQKKVSISNVFNVYNFKGQKFGIGFFGVNFWSGISSVVNFCSHSIVPIT